MKYCDLMNEDNFPLNKIRFNELLELILNNKVIPFIGAGMSADIYGTWKSIIIALANDTHEEGIKKHIQNLIQNHKYEDAIDFLYQYYNEGDFYSEIQKIFNPRLITKTKLERSKVKYLPLIFENTPVITTNYDKVLEEVFKLYDSKFEEIETSLVHKGKQSYILSNAITNFNHSLIKIHGDCKDINSIVFGKNSYEKTYTSDFKNALSRILNRYNLLFIGSSFEKDRWIEVLDETIKERNDSQNMHYAILPLPSNQSEAKELRKEMSKRKINVIWYPEGDFKSVTALLQAILKKKLANKQNNNLTQSKSFNKPFNKKNFVKEDSRRIHYKELENIQETQNNYLLSKKVLQTDGFDSITYDRLFRECYMEPIFVDSSYKNAYIKHIIEDILNAKGPKIISIVGDPGRGKATNLKKIYFDLIGDEKNLKKHKILWIDSTILKDKTNRANIIFNELQQKTFKNQYQNKKIILFIEGLDRIYCHKDSQRMKNTINTLKKSCFKIVISCREINYRAIMNSNDVVSYKPKLWSVSESLLFLERYFNNSKVFSSLQSDLNNNMKAFSKILCRPFFTLLFGYLYIEKYNRIKKNKDISNHIMINCYLLYDEFYYHWINNEFLNKPCMDNLSEKDVLKIHTKIASILYQNSESMISLKDMLDYNYLNNYAYYDRAVLSLLDVSNENDINKIKIHGLIHDSFVEFFIVKNIVQSINNEENLLSCLKIEYHEFVNDFLKDAFRALTKQENEIFVSNLTKIYKCVKKDSYNINNIEKSLIISNILFFLRLLPCDKSLHSKIIEECYKFENEIIKINACFSAIQFEHLFYIENDFYNQIIHENDTSLKNALLDFTLSFYNQKSFFKSEEINMINERNIISIKTKLFRQLNACKSGRSKNKLLFVLTQLYIFVEYSGLKITKTDKKCIKSLIDDYNFFNNIPKKELILELINMFSNCN